MYEVKGFPDSEIIIDCFEDLPEPVKVYIATAFTTGNSVPAGGKSGQVLTKLSDQDFEIGWKFLQILKFGSKEYNGIKQVECDLLDLCQLITHEDIDTLFKKEVD